MTFPPHSVPSSASLILFLESIPFSPFSIYFSQLRFLSSVTYYMRLLTPGFKSLCPLPLLLPIFLTQLTVSSHSENQSCGFHTSNQNMEVLDHCYSQNAVRRFAPYSNQTDYFLLWSITCTFICPCIFSFWNKFFQSHNC